ncbi:MAG TPA: T9SS type A sorting domain-containing protein [bacterium (Candidatus Stahlbacteria)]|nr:T9SS type A sorting domain-containing protein [Candidatus Stahlbacteria bacterium]
MRSIIILLVVSQLSGGVIVKNFEFSRNDLCFTNYGRYTLVELKGSDQINKEGEPILPASILHFVIPPDAEVSDVKVIEEEVEDLPGSYLLYPGQRPRPFTRSQVASVRFQGPEEEIYSSEKIYPEKTLEFSRSGPKGGFRIFTVTLYPLRYLPKARSLRLSKRITIKITYEEGVYPIPTITEQQYAVQKKAIKPLVTNRKDVERFKPVVRPNSITDVNYAIVTGQAFVDHYQPLADWKTKKGWMTRIFSVEWIYSNYPGNDNPEKIRNFFKDYYQNKGLVWALLGGDVQIVPTRLARTTYYEPYNIATDWYYWDLDSNWNRNGNAYYGEIGDVLPPECCYEIYGGRSPIDDATDIQNFIRKLDIFEKSPGDSGVITIILVSVQLYSGYHGRIVNNAIADMFPDYWRKIKIEDAASPATRDSINYYHPQFCHLATHGDRNGFYSYYGNPVFTEADIPYLNNDLPTILNAIGCYAGEFDCSYDDCFGEELINQTGLTDHSAGMSTMFNCRYGFGQPPNMGPSEQLDTAFYHMVCYTDTLWLGVAFAAAHEHFRNLIWTQGVWHYCGLEQNLMGEPEMGMYLDIPIPLYTAYPETIEAQPQNFTVSVTDSGGPVENALVCCYKENEVHEAGWTDATGQVTLNISPQTPGVMYVTTSCFNHLPNEDSCTVILIGVSEDRQLPKESWTVPSISKDRITINYTLPRKTEAHISLVDATGRMIKDFFQGELSGKGQLSRSVKDLSAGVYFVIIEKREKRETRRIIRLK